jgi:hypothetical protein
MRKLTRKVWVGIGAATIAGASTLGSAVAQHAGHKADQPGKAPTDEAATKDPTQGGEAYLTDGGPRDTRIRFYLTRADPRHILVGRAAPQFGTRPRRISCIPQKNCQRHGKYIKATTSGPFKLELGVLAQTVGPSAGAPTTSPVAADHALAPR